MKRLLVLDIWHGLGGGQSKAALYAQLAKDLDLIFLRAQLPAMNRVMAFAKTFDVNFSNWKKRKSRYDETQNKRPAVFRQVTATYNALIRSRSLKYDAILQTGSLFGPVDNPLKKPYFTYGDSTVRNPDLMWKPWMPDDFDALRNEWYALERKLFQNATRAFFYSRWAADTLIKEYAVNERNVSVIGSCLKMTQEAAIDWAGKKNEVLFVSTDFVRKGGAKLTAIFEQLIKTVPDAKLNVVGNVSQDMKTQKRPWLNVWGSVGKEELARLYCQAKVLLHPAEYDPFPSVVLEAANFEVPAVASRICGIPEMIEEGKTGYLVDKDDLKGFGDRLATLLKDPVLNVRLGQSAKQTVREKFHPSVVAGRMRQIMAEAI
jgi:glycosyltransferase involved in cell wall biosynthesis